MYTLNHPATTTAFNGIGEQHAVRDEHHSGHQSPIALAAARKKKAPERGRLAADWVAGRVQLKNTTINAALIFGVSRPYVSAAKGNGNGNRAPITSPLAKAWARADRSERQAFAAAYSEAFWKIIDEITS